MLNGQCREVPTAAVAFLRHSVLRHSFVLAHSCLRHCLLTLFGERDRPSASLADRFPQVAVERDAVPAVLVPEGEELSRSRPRLQPASFVRQARSMTMLSTALARWSRISFRPGWISRVVVM